MVQAQGLLVDLFITIVIRIS